MKTHVVIDGNAFYEVDEECMNRKKENIQRKMEKQQRSQPENEKYKNKK